MNNDYDDEIDLRAVMDPELVTSFEEMSFESPFIDDVFDSAKIVSASSGGGVETDVYGSIRRVARREDGWRQAAMALNVFAYKYRLSPEETNFVGMMIHLGTFPVPSELSVHRGQCVGFTRVRPANYCRVFSCAAWEYDGEVMSFVCPSYAGMDYVPQDVVKNLVMIGARGERVVISGDGTFLLQGIKAKRSGEVTHLVCSSDVSIMISSFARLYMGQYEPAVFNMEKTNRNVSYSVLYPEQHELGCSFQFEHPSRYVTSPRSQGEIYLIDGVQYRAQNVPTEELRSVNGMLMTCDNYVVGRVNVIDGMWEVGPQCQIIGPREDKLIPCSSKKFRDLQDVVTSPVLLRTIPIILGADEPVLVPTYCFGKYQPLAKRLVGGQTGTYLSESSESFNIKALLIKLKEMFKEVFTITWYDLIVTLQSYDLCVTSNDIHRACSKLGLVVTSNTVSSCGVLTDVVDVFDEPVVLVCKTGNDFGWILKSAVIFSNSENHIKPVASGMVVYDDDWMMYTKKHVGWRYCDFMAWGAVRDGESHERAMERIYLKEVGEKCVFGNNFKIMLGGVVFKYGVMTVSPPEAYGVTRLFMVKRSASSVLSLPLGDGRVMCQIDHRGRPRMRHDLRIARDQFYSCCFSPI